MADITTRWQQPYNPDMPTGRRWRVRDVQIPVNQLTNPVNTYGSGSAWTQLFVNGAIGTTWTLLHQPGSIGTVWTQLNT